MNDEVVYVVAKYPKLGKLRAKVSLIYLKDFI